MGPYCYTFICELIEWSFYPKLLLQVWMAFGEGWTPYLNISQRSKSEVASSKFRLPPEINLVAIHSLFIFVHLVMQQGDFIGWWILLCPTLRQNLIGGVETTDGSSVVCSWITFSIWKSCFEQLLASCEPILLDLECFTTELFFTKYIYRN